MRGPSNAYLRLGIVCLLLVVLPSFGLGWFCLRAVESARTAERARLLENERRYAEFAARAVGAELGEMEAAWADLRPLHIDWESRVAELGAALDAARRAERFVRRAWLLDASGRVAAFPPEPVPRVLPIPDAAALRDFVAAQERAAAVEIDDPQAAASLYADLVARSRSVRLRAIARSDRARVLLEGGDTARALAECEALLAEAPDAWDLDHYPLRLVAQLQRARTLAGVDPSGARRALDAFCIDLARSQPELGRSLAGDLAARAAGLAAHLGGGPGCPLDSTTAASGAFFVRKLERRLLRAVADGTPPATRARMVSERSDGAPYLLVTLALPAAPGARTGALVGLEIDLPRLSAAVLPGFLRQLEQSADVALALADAEGRRVAGDFSALEGAPAVVSALGEPFEFWSVVVRHRDPEHLLRAVDFRTRALLYTVLVLLLAITAGAVAVAIGLRREARVAAAKTTFVSNVSHELRTPLTSIRMYAELLEMNDAADATTRRRHLGVIRNECRRLERLIDAVLDFARLARGGRTLQLEYEEVGELVRQVAEEFREQAVAQGFHYRVEVEEDLPEARLDADAMRQALLNLLANAVKYSDGERWIEVRAFRCEDEIGIAVADRGIGIDPRDQRRIFDEFYRVDERLASERQGLGLGLAVVQRIVTAHGGRVTVASQLGRGACFTIWLQASGRDVEPRSPGRLSAEV